ncbi:MAG: hypothetical protein ABUT20_06485 [Bacteroidota bacterium]
MKKNLFRISAKRVLGALFVSTIISLSTASAQAPLVAGYHENTAVIKYIGSDNDSYVFNVTYTNDNADKFLLRILDSTGNTLFAGTYNNKKFDKRFRIEKEGNDKLNIVIKNLKDNSVQNFEIKARTQVVNDVVIRKLI